MNIIIGLGNILFSDEGIGVHIIGELQKRNMIKNTIYADLGSSSMEIDYYLTPELNKMVIIDCMIAKDAEPGCLYYLRLDDLQKNINNNNYSLHQLKFIDTVKILSILNDLPEFIIIGIAPFDIKNLSSDLSEMMKLKFNDIVIKAEKKIIEFFNAG